MKAELVRHLVAEHPELVFPGPRELMRWSRDELEREHDRLHDEMVQENDHDYLRSDGHRHPAGARRLSSVEPRVTMMRCAYCGERKPWPADFPLRIEATCTACVDRKGNGS